MRSPVPTFSSTVQVLAAMLLAAAPAAWSQSPALQDLAGLAGAADRAVIYPAREIITMDPGRPRAEALAVRDGRFMAVGSRAEVEAAAGPAARVDERFVRKVLLPGFIDPHLHSVLSALVMGTKVISIEDRDSADGEAPAVRDPETYADRLTRALAAHRGADRPFVTWGYHRAFHGEMSRQRLDALMPVFPVIVWHRSCRAFHLNSAALDAAGIDAAFIAGLDPRAAAEVDLEQGSFHGQGAVAIAARLAPLLASPGELRRGLERIETEYQRNGITLACESGAAVSRPLQTAVNAIFGDQGTPFDPCFIADGKHFAARHPDDAEALVADTEAVLGWGEGRARYLPRQVKLFTDGPVYGRQMQLKDGYADGHAGAWTMQPDAFDGAFQAYWDAGYQVHVQSNGDAALDLALASLEQAMARRPRADHRTALVNVAFAQPAQLARWAELGGVVSANPDYVTSLSSRPGALGIGRERAQHMVPLGWLLAQQLPVSFHSGAPMAPAKPLLLVWAAVNRLTADGRIMGPEHQTPRLAALRAVTLAAAHALRQEDQVGSIEVGKRADLTILDANPLDVPATWIKDIPVWGTMLEGRVQPAPAANSPSRR